MPDLCPYCHTELGTWTDDPILLPQSNTETLIGKTPCRLTHLIEIRSRINQIEDENGIDQTVWSEAIADNDKVVPIRLAQILECRRAIERILEAVGSTKEEYFNLDAEGNDIGYGQTEWIDNNLDVGFPIRGFHIEDLRHPIPVGNYIEVFAPSIITTIDAPPDDDTDISGNLWTVYNMFASASGGVGTSPTSEIKTETNTLFDNNSRKIKQTLFCEYIETDPENPPDAVSSGALANAIGRSGITPLGTFNKTPRLVQASTLFEYFFTYLFNGDVVTDNFVGTENYEYQVQSYIACIPTIATPTVSNTITIGVNLAIKRITLTTWAKQISLRGIRANGTGLISTSGAFEIISDEADPFFNEQVIKITLTAFISLFSLTEKYKFIPQHGSTVDVLSTKANFPSITSFTVDGQTTCEGFRLSNFGVPIP